MSDAYLFPGQGAEGPGMGGAALDRPGPVRRLLDRAAQALDRDLAAIIARGDPALARTELGQPALLAVSLGLALEHQAVAQTRARATAGHSVGELAAFALAGLLEPEQAIDAVIARARLMAEAARARPGTMLALRAPAPPEPLPAGVELAAHNAPTEWVLTGDRAALAAVAARHDTTPLPVSGPWHSAAMAPAATAWRPVLAAITWSRAPRIPVVTNTTGTFFTADDDPIELLVGQLTRPVAWVRTLETLREAGVSTWRVFGPGRVIRGLCRANLGAGAPVHLHEGHEARA